MKKSMITLAVILITITAYPGTKTYNREMKKSLKTLRAYEEKTDYEKLSRTFMTIAEENSNRYEPLYYAAYSYILGSWQIQEPVMKTEILQKAKECIDMAKKLTTKNDELLVIEAFYYQAMIVVNPRKYGQEYSAIANKLLRSAQSINKENPRAEFLLAQNIYYRPVEYGGGKEKALPLFSKAAEYFKNQDTGNFLNPVWGEETNAEMLKECSY